MSKVYRIILVLTLVFTAGNVFAQSGKIVGVVKDADTGETLPGANVIIDGTTRGAQTDIDGNYLLLNVKPGTYTIKASYIGYSVRAVTDVIVRTDLTTELNFELRPEVFEGEEIIVQAERELIIKDLTSSEARVSADEIDKLPVQELGDVVQLQAGVNIGNDGGVHIRGGRASEVSYVVDGIRVTDDYDRSQGLRVENQAVEELQVISGTFNAEYGQAMSGIINVVTKSGNNNFEASVMGWAGNYIVSRGDIYAGLPNSAMDLNRVGQYNLNVNVSGPIIKDKLTFFVTARQFHNDRHLNGFNAFSPHGRYTDTLDLGTNFDDYRTLYNEQVNLDDPWYSIDTVQVAQGRQVVDKLLLTDDGTRDSSLVRNPFQSYSVLSNLQYVASNKLKFNFIGAYGFEDNTRGYSHQNRLVPFGQASSQRENYSLNLKTTITPSANTYLVFNAAFRSNEFTSSLYDNFWDPRYFNYDNLGVFGIPNPGQAFQFNEVGTNNNFFNRRTQAMILKGEISSQINDRHFIKAGLEFQGDIIDFRNINLQPLAEDQGIVLDPDTPQDLIPFVELGVPPLETPNHQQFQRKPFTLSGFIQDKIEFDKLIINVGVRFDYFDPNTRIPADPRDPDITNPTLASNIYRDLNDNGVRDAGEPDVTRAEREEYWWKDASAKWQFSPRIGVAYPISSKGVIHFSYGYFFQMPSYNFLFENSQILLRQASGVSQTIFGNPDLKPETSIQYELGLKQEIMAGTAVEITGFYKDSRDYVSSGLIRETYNPTVRYANWINRDYANSRGITVAFNQNVSRNLSFALDYTFTRVEGSNSDPASEFFRALAQGNESGESLTQFIRPLNWDRSHIVNGIFFFSQETWGGNMTTRFLTGTPYTPSAPFRIRTGPTASTRDLFNTARLPNRFTIDVNLYKNFNIRGLEIRSFLNIFNLLDTEIVNGVYSDSGIPERPLIFPEAADPGMLLDPGRFAEPRRFQLGFQFSL